MDGDIKRLTNTAAVEWFSQELDAFHIHLGKTNKTVYSIRKYKSIAGI